MRPCLNLLSRRRPLLRSRPLASPRPSPRPGEPARAHRPRSAGPEGSVRVRIDVDDDRTSMHAEGIRRAFIDHLRYTIAKDDRHATPHDRFLALSLTARDRLTERWIRTQEAYRADDAKRVYYLSAEFLLGRALRNNLFNLGILEQSEAIIRQLGLS